MGLCAGLGIPFLLQPAQSWQGVQTVANARETWPAGHRLLTGILGRGGGRLCLPHGCLLAGLCWQACGEKVRSPAGTGALAKPLPRSTALHGSPCPGTAAMVRTQLEKGFYPPRRACWGCSMSGRLPWQNAAWADEVPIVLTGAPGRLETVSFGVRALAGTQNLG